MFFLIISGVIIVFASLFVLYFFSFAFIRHDLADIDDIDSEVNNFLSDYKETIRKGIAYINAQPHKTVYCNSFDGLLLAGRYFSCNSKNTVILFHGYRSSGTRDFSCAVEMYKNMGFNVLLVDQRSHGKSEGKLITFGVKEQRDVLSWVEFVLSDYGDDTQILLGGMSMGSTTVLLASGLGLPYNVKGIIADCGFTSPTDIMKIVSVKLFKTDMSFIIPILDLLCRLFGNFSLYGVSTVDALKKSSVPVLFIHGVKDNFVPYEMSKQAFESAGCEKQILLVENADHGCSFLCDAKNVSCAVNQFVNLYFN